MSPSSQLVSEVCPANSLGRLQSRGHTLLVGFRQSYDLGSQVEHLADHGGQLLNVDGRGTSENVDGRGTSENLRRKRGVDAVELQERRGLGRNVSLKPQQGPFLELELVRIFGEHLHLEA